MKLTSGNIATFTAALIQTKVVIMIYATFRKTAPFLSFFALLTCLSTSAIAEKLIKGETHYRCAQNTLKTLHYQVYLPTTSTENLPLVLCLHGAMGRGDDNAGRGIEAYRVLKQQTDQAHSAILLVPQCPKDEKWVNVDWKDGKFSLKKQIGTSLVAALDLLEEKINEYPVDRSRVYITGQSMGGYGTWAAITARPNLFAAAIPVCGGGDPSLEASIKAIPIWAFHGDADDVVPVQASRWMVEALQPLEAPIRYTELPNVKHGSMFPAWKNKALVPWLFSQRKQICETHDTASDVSEMPESTK